MTVHTRIIVEEPMGKNKPGVPETPAGARPGPKPTRGFRRAQQKRQRLLASVPDDALIVAMDLAQAEHYVWMTTVKKEPLDHLAIRNGPAGLDPLIARAQQVRAQYGLGKLVFAMEPTSHYWMSVATYLAHRSWAYVLVQPLSVKRERESTYYRHAKSDFRDAELIGNLTADRKVTWTQLPPSPVWAGLRTLAADYILTDMMMTAEQLRLQAFLERIYPEYPSAFKSVASATALAALQALPQMAHHSAVQFLAAVRAQRPGRLQATKINRFYALATGPAGAWGAPVYTDGLRRPIAHAAARYDLLQRQQQLVAEELLHYYEQTGYAPYANTIPHLPPVLHAAVLGRLGDPAQYDISRCLTKFAGIDIKENQSGQYQGATPITHRGDPLLRYLTYVAGFTLKTHEPVFRRRYQHLIRRPKDPLQKNQALVACGSKYLRTLWAVCTQRRPYDPDQAERGTKGGEKTTARP